MLNRLIRWAFRHLRELFFALVWLWAVASPTIQTLTMPKAREAVGTPTDYSPLAGRASQLLAIAVLLTCLIVLVVQRAELVRPGLTFPVLMVLPWAYLVLRDMYLGGEPVSVRLWTYPAVVLACWALRPKVSELAIVGWLIGLTAVVSLVLGVVLPAKGIFYNADGSLVTLDKAAPFGLLVGIYSHSNTLGGVMALGLPMVAQIRQRVWRYPLMVAAAGALLWSGARTSQLAVVAAVVVVLLVGVTPHKYRTAVTVSAMSAIVAVMVAMPLLNTDPGAFSNRGYIWASSLHQSQRHLFFGLGPDWYGAVGQTVRTLGPTVSSGHSQFVHSQVTGGFVLVALVGLLWFASSVAAGRLARRSSLFGVGFMTILLVSGLLEAVMPFVDNYALLPVLTLPLAVLLCTDATIYSGRPGPATQPSRGRRTATPQT